MRRLLLASPLALAPSLAAAHPGLGSAHDLAHGFMHPIGGLDHVLAMVAVGMFAVQLGGRALWAVPAAFVATMAVAGALGMAGIAVPYVEAGIALSVIVLGGAIALNIAMPVAAAMVLVGLFAVSHGHAHGAEMPASQSGLGYGLGFVAATALLHAVGIGMGLALGGIAKGRTVARLAGGAAAVAGAALLITAA